MNNPQDMHEVVFVTSLFAVMKYGARAISQRNGLSVRRHCPSQWGRHGSGNWRWVGTSYPVRKLTKMSAKCPGSLPLFFFHSTTPAVLATFMSIQQKLESFLEEGTSIETCLYQINMLTGLYFIVLVNNRYARVQITVGCNISILVILDARRLYVNWTTD